MTCQCSLNDAKLAIEIMIQSSYEWKYYQLIMKKKKKKIERKQQQQHHFAPDRIRTRNRRIKGNWSIHYTTNTALPLPIVYSVLQYDNCLFL